MSFIDTEFPELLGAELLRPKPAYITKFVIQPRVKYDWTKGPGDTVQLDRYKYWADTDTNGNYEASLTKDARSRSMVQTIGIGSSREIVKDKIILHLREFQGPPDPNNPNNPSTFQIPIQKIMTAERAFWEYGATGFHDSLGSANLLDDFRRWEDRVFVNELLKTSFTHNPDDIADGGTYDLAGYGGIPPRHTIDDSDFIVTRLFERNAPKFDDGNYWCLCTPEFMRHLQRDPEFKEVARYPGNIMVSQMTPGAAPMAPPQINPAASAQYLMGLQAGQASDVAGQTVMPTGLQYRGVRYFVSNNLPKQYTTLTYSNSGNTTKYPNGSNLRKAELGIFFGPEAVAQGLGGMGPSIRINNNDDFQRFVIAAWFMYGDWELADERFVHVARSYSS